MSAERMMKTPCTVIQRVPTGSTDRHGDAINKLVEVETRCSLQKVRGTEHEGGGEVSDTSWRLWLPWGIEIDAGAAVRAKGRQYEVVGDPWEAEEGSRGLWHVEADLRRTSGSGGES